MRVLKPALISLAAGLSISPLSAQDWPEWLEPRQLFHVEIDGEGANGFAITPTGTAFAIGPNTLITAAHVPGERFLFANKGKDGHFVPDRDVIVTFARGKRQADGISPELKATVTRSSFETVDGARLNFLDLGARPFPLSACPISDPAARYTVLKMRKDNAIDKVHLPVTVELKRKSFGISEFGDVTVFEDTGATNEGIENGDSGSPVLDAELNVIGLVSAVDGTDVFVTLTRDFIGLVPPEIPVVCSDRHLPDTVESLKARIAKLETDMADRKKEIGQNTRLIGGLTESFKNINRKVNAAISAMERGVEELLDAEKIEELIAKITSGVPVKPQVNRISQELGAPNWGFSGQIDAGNNTTLTLAYDRQLSGDPFSEEVFFCMTPLFREGPGSAAEATPTSIDFYQDLDQNAISGKTDLELCYPGTHETNDELDKVKKAAYIASLPVRNLKIDISADERFNKVDANPSYQPWNGQYYLQVVIEGAPEREIAPDGPVQNTILRRKIVDLLPETPEGFVARPLPCKLFTNVNQVLDFVTEADPNKKQLSDNNTC
ncbi:MAG: hypothetical protein AAGA12_03480 [Pseudomonadota bacterium]